MFLQQPRCPSPSSRTSTKAPFSPHRAETIRFHGTLSYVEIGVQKTWQEQLLELVLVEMRMDFGGRSCRLVVLRVPIRLGCCHEWSYQSNQDGWNLSSECVLQFSYIKLKDDDLRHSSSCLDIQEI